jgi:GT2 family glycosyltransferase
MSTELQETRFPPPGASAGGLAHRVSIGITTRNRWDDLNLTLTRLHEAGYSALETVVIDDGSNPPRPADFDLRFPWVRFIRSDRPEGHLAQRNRLFRLLTTPLFLQLDDDSFPVAGDLATACDWLDAHPKVFALTFRIIFRDDQVPPGFATQPPFPVRDFIGCAALIKRAEFLALGGYEEKLGFYMEEVEFSMRALQHDYSVKAYPALVIRHNLSSSERNFRERARWMILNEIQVALMLFPFPYSYRRLLTCVPGFFVKRPEYRPYWREMIVGAFQAFRNHLAGHFRRQRLTLPQFWAWRKLPFAGVAFGPAPLSSKETPP